jgi:hypothetical protein
MNLNQTRLEVMQYMAQTMDQIVEAFLKKIDENWNLLIFCLKATAKISWKK